MPTTCTRCENSGFLNLHQMPEGEITKADNSPDMEKYIIGWINDNEDHDVQVCDCCGDGSDWYGTPGEHYNSEDPRGQDGPYSYNGGLCECH